MKFGLVRTRFGLPENPRELVVREAQPADAEQLVLLVQRIADEPNSNILLGPGEFRVTLEEERVILAEHNAMDNAIFLVAEVDGHIVGVLSCQGGKCKAVRHAVVLGVSVDKHWRRQGIGRALMTQAILWAKQSGVVKRIELSVFARHEHAIHLYQTIGFAVEGRRRRSICRDGEYLDDILMAWVLE